MTHKKLKSQCSHFTPRSYHIKPKAIIHNLDFRHIRERSSNLKLYNYNINIYIKSIN